jgi:hypothetical protein
MHHYVISSRRLMHHYVIIAETDAPVLRHNRCKALWRQHTYLYLHPCPLLSYTLQRLFWLAEPTDLICIKRALSWPVYRGPLYYYRPFLSPFTTRSWMLRTYSYPNPHGSPRTYSYPDTHRWAEMSNRATYPSCIYDKILFHGISKTLT